MGDCVMVEDCDNVPFSAQRLEVSLGNGKCDEGTTGSTSTPNLNCMLFEYDENDCEKPVICGHMKICTFFFCIIASTHR